MTPASKLWKLPWKLNTSQVKALFSVDILRLVGIIAQVKNTISILNNLL